MRDWRMVYGAACVGDWNLLVYLVTFILLLNKRMGTVVIKLINPWNSHQSCIAHYDVHLGPDHKSSIYLQNLNPDFYKELHWTYHAGNHHRFEFFRMQIEKVQPFNWLINARLHGHMIHDRTNVTKSKIAKTFGLTKEALFIHVLDHDTAHGHLKNKYEADFEQDGLVSYASFENF